MHMWWENSVHSELMLTKVLKVHNNVALTVGIKIIWLRLRNKVQEEHDSFW